MAATVAIETASRFRPIEELYDDPPGKYAYFESMYGAGRHPSAIAMGNTQVGDGARYFGRGYIQITWKNNYRYYGNIIGVDLVSNPELALDPTISANIAALFWLNRDIQTQADREDWTAVRASVQGGSNGLNRLISISTNLLAIARAKGAI